MWPCAPPSAKSWHVVTQPSISPSVRLSCGMLASLWLHWELHLVDRVKMHKIYRRANMVQCQITMLLQQFAEIKLYTLQMGCIIVCSTPLHTSPHSAASIKTMEMPLLQTSCSSSRVYQSHSYLLMLPLSGVLFSGWYTFQMTTTTNNPLSLEGGTCCTTPLHHS